MSQIVHSHLPNMVDTHEQYLRRPRLFINGMAKPGTRKMLIMPMI